MKKIFHYLIFLGLLVQVQMLPGQAEDAFPRDTSFTVWSTARKIAKAYPQAVPVGEFTTLPITGYRDLVYCQTGKRELHLDLFLPEKPEGELPVVVCIHGGGWASGNKSHLVPLAQQLAARGFAGISVEYRLSPEALYPAGVNDIKTAIKWLKANAPAYHLDTARIAVLGTSAGATLATLTGTTAGSPLYPGTVPFPGVSDRVRAIVNIDGPLDFTDPAESAKDTIPSKPSAAARWFGVTLAQNPAPWKEASPVNHVGPDSPSILFVNSSLPRYHVGRDAYIAVLDENGIYSEVHTIPDTPHPFWLFEPWFGETLEIVTLFLQRTLE
ncbi:MAG: alpha/beta hydrolase fold domain-containing protein [Bacteroidota bacterium]